MRVLGKPLRWPAGSTFPSTLPYWGNIQHFYVFVVLEVESRAPRKLGTHFTTEVHSYPSVTDLVFHEPHSGRGSENEKKKKKSCYSCPAGISVIWKEHYEGKWSDNFSSQGFGGSISMEVALKLEARVRAGEVQRGMDRKAEKPEQQGCWDHFYRILKI